MQAPGVEGIQAFRQGFGDCPCLTPIEQNWEDVGPVEVQHLGICMYMGPPDVLFKETEALSCNRYTSQYLSLTSSIMRDQRPEVNKLVHQVDFTCTTMKK